MIAKTDWLPASSLPQTHPIFISLKLVKQKVVGQQFKSNAENPVIPASLAPLSAKVMELRSNLEEKRPDKKQIKHEPARGITAILEIIILYK